MAMRCAFVRCCHGDMARGHIATDVILMMVVAVSFTVNLWQCELSTSSSAWPWDLDGLLLLLL